MPDDVVRVPRLPAAAGGVGARSAAVRRLYLFTVLSAADGSLVVLAASGAFRDPWQAVVVGLSVVAGVGSWIAATEAFGGRLDRAAWRSLAALGVLALGGTLASVMAGTQLGDAVTLLVLPKVAGLAIALLALETAGLRMPKLAGGSPALAVLALGAVVEVFAQWTAS